MIKQLKYILLILLLISCKNNTINKPRKPDNLISKDKMVAIIYDISLINSAKGVNKKLIESNGIVPEDYIYKRHDIDSLQFALSNEYYSYSLETYEGIYNSVKIKLEDDRKRFNEMIEAEKKAKDSIRKNSRKKLDSLSTLEKLNLKRPLKRKSIKPSPLKKADTSQIPTRQ